MKKSNLAGGLAALIILTSGSAYSAVSRDSASAVNGSLQATKDALDLPMLERVSTLRGQPHAYDNLKHIMFSKSNSMDLRWKAVTAIGRIGKEKAKSDLLSALQAREWYMRNAGLIALANVDRAESLVWARKLLSDRALVVRSAAVDMIAQSHDAGSSMLLWQKLYSKENYRNKQSLFIRRRIVETLADLEGKGAESKLVGVLQDKDKSLHEPAMEALERITKRTVGTPGEPTEFRRAKWEQWYKENKATL